VIRQAVRLGDFRSAEAHVDVVHQHEKDGQAAEEVHAVESGFGGDVLFCSNLVAGCCCALRLGSGSVVFKRSVGGESKLVAGVCARGGGRGIDTLGSESESGAESVHKSGRHAIDEPSGMEISFATAGCN